MDQLEKWLVRARLAAAASRVRESMARLASDGQELDAALAEAQQLSLETKTAAAAAGVGQ